MRRAVPAIALSAAGVTGLLYYQRIIDVGLATMTVTAGGASSLSGSSGSGGSGGGDTKTVPGQTITSDYGPIQVAAVVQGSKLIDVQPLQIPLTDPNSKRINTAAVPMLREAALKAQSAKFDAVSGATFTSKGYKDSLQTALDAAQFHAGAQDEMAMGASTTTTGASTTTSAAGGPTTTAAKGTSGGSPSAGAKGATTTKAPSGGGSGGAAGGATPKTYDGSVETHQFGPVQVQVTISGGRITEVKALQSPGAVKGADPMTVSINGNALPTLKSEAIAAQSANIAAVSGATLTSKAFKTSLQNALAQAGLNG